MDKKKTQTADDALAGQKPGFIVEKGKETWAGQTLEYTAPPVIDPGIGRPQIIRCFTFKKNPEIKQLLSNQDLFNFHWRQIRSVMWGDGLVPNEDANPRIVHKKDGIYQIFVLARPRMNTIVADNPTNLQKIIGSSP